MNNPDFIEIFYQMLIDYEIIVDGFYCLSEYTVINNELLFIVYTNGEDYYIIIVNLKNNISLDNIDYDLFYYKDIMYVKKLYFERIYKREWVLGDLLGINFMDD